MNKTKQKLAIMGSEVGEIEIKEVPATIVDVGAEYVTFVHRDHRYYEPTGSPSLYRQRPHYFSTWLVSEQSTGCSIAGGKTRKSAIENATGKIKEVGATNMQIAVENQAAYLTRHNVALV